MDGMHFTTCATLAIVNISATSFSWDVSVAQLSASMSGVVLSELSRSWVRISLEAKYLLAQLIYYLLYVYK